MPVALAAVLPVDAADRIDGSVRRLQDEWRWREPLLERYWTGENASDTVSVLAALIKADLGCRYARGQRPAVRDYLARFPDLREHDDRVLSLIYEEFCLREEAGEKPDAEQFCNGYQPWRDSLVSQLRYHRLLSQVVGPTQPVPRFPEPGEQFEEFHLESLLGQGGAARVYLARDESLAGRKVALKVSSDRGNEPSILGRLDHRHIVPVHSVVFQTETRLRGLCMPYRPGLPLDEVIHRIGPSSLPRGASALREVVASSGGEDASAGWDGFPRDGTYVEAAAWVVATLARALAYAHSHGILHRDVKPANVLLTLRDGPQLLDFNLAHDPHSPDQAEAALRGGTLPYMAPEQLEAFVDPQSWDHVGAGADLYSLGLLLRELLTGRAPDPPDPTLSLPRAIGLMLDRRRVLADSPIPSHPRLPHALEAILAHCLAYSPSNRYPDALSLAEDLDRFLHHRPLRYASNSSRPERIRNWTIRNRTTVAALAVAFALLGAAFSRSIRAAVVPVEKRADFVDAVRFLDNRDYRGALPALEHLERDYPDSPLVRFYLSVAFLGQKNLDEASRNFSALLRADAPESSLLRWRPRDPHVADHLESLGRALLDQNAFSLAGSAFQLALKIEPRSPRARQGVAEVLAENRRFPQALDILTQLIDEAKARDSQTEREQLDHWYRLRALMTVRSVEYQQSRDQNDTSPANRARLRAALEDLELSRQSSNLNNLSNASEFMTYLVDAEAWITLGDTDSRDGRWDEARLSFERARRSVKEMKARDDNQEYQYRRLLQKLDGMSKRCADRETASSSHVAASSSLPGAPK